MPVYADNPSNRKLNRVGLEKGSVKAPLSPRRQKGGAREGKKKKPQGPELPPGGLPEPEKVKVPKLQLSDKTGQADLSVGGGGGWKQERDEFFSENAPGSKDIGSYGSKLFGGRYAYGVTGMYAAARGHNTGPYSMKARHPTLQLEKSKITGILPPMSTLKKKETSLKSQLAKRKKRVAAGFVFEEHQVEEEGHEAETQEKLDAIKQMIVMLKKKESANIDLSNAAASQSRGPPVALVQKYPSKVKVSVRPAINKVDISERPYGKYPGKYKYGYTEGGGRRVSVAPPGYHFMDMKVMPPQLMKDEVHELKLKGPAQIKMSVKPAINKVKLLNKKDKIENNPEVKRLRKEIKISEKKIDKWKVSAELMEGEFSGSKEYKDAMKKVKKYTGILKGEKAELAEALNFLST